MTLPAPQLSIVIPTLNRKQAIVDLIHDLQAQDHPSFEIIVVDAGREENSVLQALAMTDKRITVLRITSGGTCYARNTGVARARGQIVVFTDDDVRLSNRQFLSIHARNYADPAIGGVGGRVLDANQELNREQSVPVCKVTTTGRVYPNATSRVRQDINAPRGGNMSFRKQIILDVGGFDEQFRGNAMREETDFSLRVVKAGWRIIYEPSAALTHLALTGGSRTADRLQWYRDFFFNESYFFLKHVRPAYWPLLLWRKMRPLIVCWLYYGRGRPAWFIAPWQAFADARRLLQKKSSIT